MRTSWSEKTVVYHIYVRSFKDSNNDGVGDLGGVIEKLKYLNDETKNSLGVDAVWLSPIYPSPNADFGYDISEFCNINPEYGDLDTFKELITQAHNSGIKILMDYVPNHTSDEHAWFKESRSSKVNPKRDYYIWKEPKDDGGPPNNWISTIGNSAWEFDRETGQYYFHSFHMKQPDLNWRNPDLVNEMLNVLRFWLEMGVDGFRVDVPEWMFKDPDFRDEPPNPEFNHDWPDKYGSLLHIYTQGLPESTQMIKRFREVLDEYEDKFMVTEMWTTLERLIRIYSDVGRKLFTPFNFNLIELPWNAIEHRKFIDAYDGGIGNLYFPNYVLGNHDKPRVASRIGREKIRTAAVLQMTLRGIPFIYYGEEIGMENGEISGEEIKDPIELLIPGIGLGRDPERTPMQWNSQEHGGFSTSKPWLKVASNYIDLNVEKEQSDKNSLLNLYKTLIKLRKQEQALTFGTYASLDLGFENVFSFLRIYGKEIILVVLNYDNLTCMINLPLNKGTIICDSELERQGEEVELNSLELKPNQSLVIKSH